MCVLNLASRNNKTVEMENRSVVVMGREQGRDEVGSANVNGNMKELLDCGDGTDLCLDHGGGFKNLSMR